MATYIYTSISRNYVPKAKVLAESVKKHTPDVRFCLLLADPASCASEVSSPLFDEVMTADNLDIPLFHSWIFKHDLVEACTAVKGRCLQNLLERDDCDCVFYFDPDILVLCDVNRLAREFDRGSVLLTPHLTTPESNTEAVLDNEVCALRHGVYNLGFLGVKNTPAGRQFADWWWSRLYEFCYDDISRGLFTDQRWVDLAPGFFEGVALVRNPGWNLATWNLTGRTVSGTLDSGLTANGEPVLFYHFSGLDSGAQLAMLDKYGSSISALYDLRSWYLERCREHESDILGPSATSWSYGHYANGVPIEAEHRVLYRERRDLQEAFPDPFRTDDVNQSYYHWFIVNGPNEWTRGKTDADARAAVYKQELDAIKNSRSWRVAVFLQKTLGPVLAFGKRGRAMLARRDR